MPLDFKTSGLEHNFLPLIKNIASGNVKMDYCVWSPDKSYYRNKDGDPTSDDEKNTIWLQYLDFIRDIAIDYNYSVQGETPCWDEDAPMDRIIYADINLASDLQLLDALLNKWNRLAGSLYNGELGADVKCITIRLRVESHKLFVWTEKGLSRDVLVQIRDKCQQITDGCEQQINLVWDIYQ